MGNRCPIKRQCADNPGNGGRGGWRLAWKKIPLALLPSYLPMRRFILIEQTPQYYGGRSTAGRKPGRAQPGSWRAPQDQRTQARRSHPAIFFQSRAI